MDKFYLYQYTEVSTNSVNIITVLFIAGENIEKIKVKDTLKYFFTEKQPPTKIYVVCGSYLKDDLINTFTKSEDILNVIPNYLKFNHSKDLTLLCFNSNGELRNAINNQPLKPAIDQKLRRQGLFQIFDDRGGIIEAPESHHYVFPSGKHCTKFLRTGNILLYGSEIEFIAFNLLRYLKRTTRYIYCDTSSINSIAFSLVLLHKRFFSNSSSPAINSFGSYEKFESFEFNATDESLIIISSSTSGNIIKRLLESNKGFLPKNIIILYYLGESKEYLNQILCDLSKQDDLNPNGYNYLDINDPTKEDCQACKLGSYPVKVTGDVFLLEKPKVKNITLVKKDAPIWLNQFMKNYHSVRRTKNNLIKCNYSERSEQDLEIYLDLKTIHSNLFTKRNRFGEYARRFIHKLNQGVPANLKYIVYLDDEASEIMSLQVKEFVEKSNPKATIQLIPQSKLNDARISNGNGAILVVSSCMITGTNLLYVNKYLRKYNKLTKTFLVGLIRTENREHLDFVSKNLGQGNLYGVNTNSFLFVDQITCPSDFKSNPWKNEYSFLKDLLTYMQNSKIKNNHAVNYYSDRIKKLEESQSVRKRGLSNDLFLINPIINQDLTIRKNYVFFDFDGYHKNVSQADIYFTITATLNRMRYLKEPDRRLEQHEYLRSVLDPENFIRFDDGIIQASLLRAANLFELKYNLQYSLSKRMLQVLFTVIRNYNNLSGEALIEFLLAVATGKLQLDESHLKELVIEGKSLIKHKTILPLFQYIQDIIIEKKRHLINA